MLRRRSSISSINTSRIKERRFKIAFSGLGNWLKKLGVLAIIILLIFVGFQMLIVKEIVCRTNNRSCAGDLENLLLHLKGKNVISIDQKDLEETIKNILPVETVTYNFKFPNKLEVNVTGMQEAFPVDTYQVVTYPTLSLDTASGSTDSGSWRKPGIELREFISGQEPKYQRLWEKGRLTADSTISGEIKDIFVSGRDEETLTNIYQLIVLSEKYLSDPKIIIMGDRFFLSQEGLPDIIIYIPADTGNVESALQSLDYLVTIKKDAKVIDLSFKHPIIK